MSIYANEQPAARASVQSTMPDERVNLFNLPLGTTLPMEIVRTKGFANSPDFVIPQFIVRQTGVKTGTPVEFEISLSWGTDGTKEDYRRVDPANNHHRNEALMLDTMLDTMHAEYDPQVLTWTASDLRGFAMNLVGLSFNLTKVAEGKIEPRFIKTSDAWVDIELTDFEAPKPVEAPKAKK